MNKGKKLEEEDEKLCLYKARETVEVDFRIELMTSETATMRDNCTRSDWTPVNERRNHRHGRKKLWQLSVSRYSSQQRDNGLQKLVESKS